MTGFFIMKIKIFISCLIAFALVGCGGGGSDAPSTPTTVTFPFKAAYDSFIRKSSSANFSISGNCNGSGSETWGAPVASNLYGATYSRTRIMTLVYSNCTGSGVTTTNAYYDNNFNLLAVVADNGNYSERVVINQRPTNVKVGDTMQLATIKIYSNSFKNILLNNANLSFTIENDSNSSVIVNYVSQFYKSSGVLEQTAQERIKLTSSGELIPVSYRIDNPSGQYEIWTYR
jgi:hypothetical protein